MTFDQCKEIFKKHSSKLKQINKGTKLANNLNGIIKEQSPKKSAKKQPNSTNNLSKDPYSKLIQERLDDLNQIRNSKEKINTDTQNYMREPNLKGLTPIFDYEMFVFLFSR